MRKFDILRERWQGVVHRFKLTSNMQATILLAITNSVAAISSSAAPRVAIVGGGIGGAATAHFLAELRPDVQIDVFEALPNIGGRAHTLDASVFGVPLDAGATDIFSKNKYLVSFVERFGLAKAVESGKDVIGLWDGNGFRFQWPDTALLPARILARYGPSPLHVIKAVDDAVGRLLRIYDLQERNVSFASPEALFDALQLTNLTQHDARSYFEGTLHVAPKFVDEFVTGASRDNYNQGSAINAFVDLVSLAGAGIGGTIFSLANGTTPLVAALLSTSPHVTVHTSTPVASISRAATDRGFAVTLGAAGREATAASSHYDAVALATPLERSTGLHLHTPPATLNSTRPYQRTCVTFVSGRVDGRYFGLGAGDEPPTEMLTVENASLPMSTLAVHATLANGTRVFKLFSKTPIDEPTLDAIFRTRHRTRRLDWPAAYPKLNPTPAATTWPPFEVPLGGERADVDARVKGRGGRPLVYVNAMESAVSCMETQVIAAKNAALRIVRLLD